MAGNITLRNGGWTQLMSTELNSLAAATGAVQSTGTNPAYDNSNISTSYFWAAFELRVTVPVAPTAGKTVDVYLIPLSSDGVNFVDGSATIQQTSLLVGSFVLRAVTSAQVLMFSEVPLPNDKFIISIVNNGDQAFAASGNTIKVRTYAEFYN